MQDQKDEYNEEPVLYCKKCLSLRVKTVGLNDLDYCDECGATNIEQCNIEEWESLYIKRFGHRYLDNY